MNDIKTMTQIKKLCEAYMYYYATGGGSEPVGDSYIQLSNGKLIYFDATNTTVNDIVNFTFNGKTVDRYFIQHLSFGESYLTVTSLPDGFCSYMDNLLSVNTDNFINVTSVGEEVFANLYSLEHFDFTNFGNLVNAGGNFLISMNSIVTIDLSNINENFNAAGGMLAWCQTISEIIINDTDTTNINFGSYFLYGVPNESSRNIVASNNDLVNIFKSKAQDNAISEWSGLVENDSYIQLANGELIYFNATNTPVANLVQNNYIINGQPVNAGLIKHIDFGGSYLLVTSLPDYFCCGLGIETAGLSGLANVTVFGYENFAYTRSLKHFDFTVFNGPISSPGFSNFLINSAIESVDISQYHVESNLGGTFIDCMNLKEIIINDTDFSNHSDMCYWFYRVNNDSSRKIKANSQELVDILKDKTCGNISEWSMPVESYYALVSDPETRIEFHIDNTPFANFCTSGGDTSSITINGESVVKNTIKELSFGDEYSITTTIPSNFLRYLPSLSTVDLSVFSNVTSIVFNFLDGCSSLTSVDLSPFSNITSTGYYFLNGCSGLTSIDLSPLSNVTSVGHSFLRSCSRLTSVDLSSFSDVTSIGNYFLSQSSGLTSVDLSPLKNVTSVGHNFLSQCTGLTSVTIDAGDWSTKTISTDKMSGVGNLSTNTVISNTSCELANNFKTAIGESISNWTVDCPVPIVSYYTLVSDPTTEIPFNIDNTPLANFCTSGNATSSITINGQSVVKNTIKELSFADEYSNTTTIPRYFLRHFSSLSTVDLSVFSNVTSVGKEFLQWCSSLTSVDLSRLSNVSSINASLLYGCSSLTSVDLSSFSNVASVGNSFLYGCSGLTSVDLSPLSNVTTIGSTFLQDCSSLTSVDLVSLHKIKTIGDYFLGGCTSLTSIDLSPLSNVTIGTYILYNSAGVTTIKLNAPLDGLTPDANNFYSSTPRTGTIVTDTNNDTFGNNLIANNSALSTWTVQTGNEDILSHVYQPLDTNFNSVLPVKEPTSSNLSSTSSFSNCLQVTGYDNETYSLIDLGTPQNIQYGDCLSFWFAPIDIARAGYNIYESIGGADVFGPVVIRTDGWNALTMTYENGMLQPRYYDNRWNSSIINVEDPTWHFIQMWIDETNDSLFRVNTYIDNILIDTQVVGPEGIQYNTFGFSLGSIRNSIPGYYHRASFTNVGPAGRELIYKNAGIIAPVLLIQ